MRPDSSDVYISRPLARYLLDRADEADPQKVSLLLTTTDGATIAAAPDDADVFTGFYLDGVQAPLRRVFGVNLGIPPGQTAGRFISHPEGDRGVRLTDDLHSIIFVGIPPWTPDDIEAYGGAGGRRDVRVIDVDLPAPEFDPGLDLDVGDPDA